MCRLPYTVKQNNPYLPRKEDMHHTTAYKELIDWPRNANAMDVTVAIVHVGKTQRDVRIAAFSTLPTGGGSEQPTSDSQNARERGKENPEKACVCVCIPPPPSYLLCSLNFPSSWHKARVVSFRD